MSKDDIRVKEKRCECCDSDYEDGYYKYDNKLYCFDCLVKMLEDDKKLYAVTITHYYDDDWGKLGTSDDIEEVIQNICEEYDVEEIES